MGCKTGNLLEYSQVFGMATISLLEVLEVHYPLYLIQKPITHYCLAIYSKSAGNWLVTQYTSLSFIKMVFTIIIIIGKFSSEVYSVGAMKIAQVSTIECVHLRN